MLYLGVGGDYKPKAKRIYINQVFVKETQLQKKVASRVLVVATDKSIAGQTLLGDDEVFCVQNL